MNRNPECNSVDNNWHSLKETLTVSVSNHVPKKKLKSCKDLPWLTRDIKRAMKYCKKLFDHAKQHNTEESWSNYRRAHNKVNKALQVAHEQYRNRILDTTFSGHQCQFWKYIKTMKKSTSSIPFLTVNGHTVTKAKDRATALNNQFQSVFTVEDLSNVPEIGTGNYNMMQPIQFSEAGIQALLQNLDTNKSPGPDGIHPIILKHCASELAPILKVIFTQSLNTGNIPAD